MTKEKKDPNKGKYFHDFMVANRDHPIVRRNTDEQNLDLYANYYNANGKIVKDRNAFKEKYGFNKYIYDKEGYSTGDYIDSAQEGLLGTLGSAGDALGFNDNFLQKWAKDQKNDMSAGGKYGHSLNYFGDGNKFGDTAGVGDAGMVVASGIGSMAAAVGPGGLAVKAVGTAGKTFNWANTALKAKRAGQVAGLGTEAAGMAGGGEERAREEVASATIDQLKTHPEYARLEKEWMDKEGIKILPDDTEDMIESIRYDIANREEWKAKGVHGALGLATGFIGKKLVLDPLLDKVNGVIPKKATGFSSAMAESSRSGATRAAAIAESGQEVVQSLGEQVAGNALASQYKEDEYRKEKGGLTKGWENAATKGAIGGAGAGGFVGALSYQPISENQRKIQEQLEKHKTKKSDALEESDDESIDEISLLDDDGFTDNSLPENNGILSTDNSVKEVDEKAYEYLDDPDNGEILTDLMGQVDSEQYDSALAMLGSAESSSEAVERLRTMLSIATTGDSNLDGNTPLTEVSDGGDTRIGETYSREDLGLPLRVLSTDINNSSQPRISSPVFSSEELGRVSIMPVDKQVEAISHVAEDAENRGADVNALVDIVQTATTVNDAVSAINNEVAKVEQAQQRTYQTDMINHGESTLSQLGDKAANAFFDQYINPLQSAGEQEQALAQIGEQYSRGETMPELEAFRSPVVDTQSGTKKTKGEVPSETTAKVSASDADIAPSVNPEADLDGGTRIPVEEILSEQNDNSEIQNNYMASVLEAAQNTGVPPEALTQIVSNASDVRVMTKQIDQAVATLDEQTAAEKNDDSDNQDGHELGPSDEDKLANLIDDAEGLGLSEELNMLDDAYWDEPTEDYINAVQTLINENKGGANETQQQNQVPDKVKLATLDEQTAAEKNDDSDNQDGHELGPSDEDKLATLIDEAEKLGLFKEDFYVPELVNAGMGTPDIIDILQTSINDKRNDEKETQQQNQVPDKVKLATLDEQAVAERTDDSDNIEDFGEIIPGARKHTSTKRGKKPKPTDNRPPWRRKYVITPDTASGRFQAAKVTKSTKKILRNKENYAVRDFASEAEAELAILYDAVLENNFVSKKGDGHAISRFVSNRKTVVIKDNFDSREDAINYLLSNAEEIINTKVRITDAIRPYLEEITRTGEKTREGDVAPKMFEESFGFRGVQFGNWMKDSKSTNDRKQALNYAYDALIDLADALDIPYKAISLNGELGLAFGARGSGGRGAASAHYEPNEVVINLTKKRGSGTLAHEWFHAVDHYFGRQEGLDKLRLGSNTLPFASHVLRYMDGGIRAEVKAKIKAVKKAISRQNIVEYITGVEKGSATKILDKMDSEVIEILGRIEADLKEQKPYGKRFTKPATKDQMDLFDTIKQKILVGQGLEPIARKTKSRTIYEETTETINELSTLYKKVRGRAGFSNNGIMNHLMRVISRKNRFNEQQEKDLADESEGKTSTRSAVSNYASEASRMDKGSVGDYWSTNHELIARAFEGYIFDKIDQQKNKSEYLVHGVENKDYKALDVKPYPEGQERTDINKAFDDLFKTIKTRTTEHTDEDGNTKTNTEMYRTHQNTENTEAVTTKQAQSIVDDFIKQYTGDANVQINLVENSEHTGSYLNGRVSIDPAGLSEAELNKTLRHEVLAHYGLDVLAPTDKQAILDKIIASKDGLSEQWNKITKDGHYETLSETKQAEEVLALISEDQRNAPQKIWDEIVTLIRKALRSVGLVSDLSAHEARRVVEDLADNIKHGQLRAVNLLSLIGNASFTSEPADPPMHQTKKRVKHWTLKPENAAYRSALASIDKKANTQEEADVVMKETIEDMRNNPEKYIIKSDPIRVRFEDWLKKPDDPDDDTDFLKNFRESYKSLYDSTAKKGEEDLKFREQLSDRINKERIDAHVKNLKYFTASNYAPVEVVAGVRAYTGTFAKFSAGKIKAQSITPQNMQTPLDASMSGGEAVAAIKSGARLKEAVRIAVKKRAEAAENASVYRKDKTTGWVKFPQSSTEEAAIEVNNAVKGSEWCVGFETLGYAKQYRSQGDYHVYYDEGVPEIAITIDPKTGGLVNNEVPRGNLPEQKLSQEHTDIAMHKLSEKGFEGAKAWVDENKEIRKMHESLKKGVITDYAWKIFWGATKPITMGELQSGLSPRLPDPNSDAGALLGPYSKLFQSEVPKQIEEVLAGGATRIYFPVEIDDASLAEKYFSEVRAFESSVDFEVKITLPNLKTITGYAEFRAETTLDNLKTIGGYAHFFAETTLDKLETIGGGAAFNVETTLPNLKTIDGYAIFDAETTLDKLETIGRDAKFRAKTTLDNLKTIGGDAEFEVETTLDKLKTIGGDAHFFAETTLDKLETIGGDAEFEVETTLDNLKTIGGYAIFNAETTLPKIESIDEKPFVAEDYPMVSRTPDLDTSMTTQEETVAEQQDIRFRLSPVDNARRVMGDPIAWQQQADSIAEYDRDMRDNAQAQILINSKPASPAVLDHDLRVGASEYIEYRGFPLSAIDNGDGTVDVFLSTSMEAHLLASGARNSLPDISKLADNVLDQLPEKITDNLVNIDQNIDQNSEKPIYRRYTNITPNPLVDSKKRHDRQTFSKDFGFGVKDKDNDDDFAYLAMSDLSEALALPKRSMSLQGKVTLDNTQFSNTEQMANLWWDGLNQHLTQMPLNREEFNHYVQWRVKAYSGLMSYTQTTGDSIPSEAIEAGGNQLMSMIYASQQESDLSVPYKRQQGFGVITYSREMNPKRFIPVTESDSVQTLIDAVKMTNERRFIMQTSSPDESAVAAKINRQIQNDTGMEPLDIVENGRSLSSSGDKIGNQYNGKKGGLNINTVKKILSKTPFAEAIDSLLDSGKLVIVDAGTAKGWVKDGIITLNASKLNKKNVLAVLMHEAFHAYVPMDQKLKILNKLKSMEKQSHLQKFFGKAYLRVPMQTDPDVFVEELGAYVVEEWVEANGFTDVSGVPILIGHWVRTLNELLRSAMDVIGFRTQEVSEIDLAMIAADALREAPNRVQGGGLITPKYYVGKTSALDEEGNHLYDALLSTDDQPSKMYGTDNDGNVKLEFNKDENGSWSSGENSFADESDVFEYITKQGLTSHKGSRDGAGESYKDKFGGESKDQQSSSYLSKFKPTMNWIRRGLADAYDPIRRIDEKYFETILTDIKDGKFGGDIKNLRDYEKEFGGHNAAWKLTRMTHAAGNGLQTLLHDGLVHLDAGAINTDTGGKGFLKFLHDDLGDKDVIDDFFHWMAGNRSADITHKSREAQAAVDGEKLNLKKLKNMLKEDFKQIQEDKADAYYNLNRLQEKGVGGRERLAAERKVYELKKSPSKRKIEESINASEQKIKKLKDRAKVTERLFEEDEVLAMKQLSKGREEQFEKARKRFMEFNESVLQVAIDTGTLSEEEVAAFNDEFYVPFFRILSDEKGSFYDPKSVIPVAGRSGAGMIRKKAYEKMKGGKDNLNDLMHNTVLNWERMLSVSLKNQASVRVMDNGMAIGAIEEVSASDNGDPDVVWIKREGQKEYYRIIEDDGLIAALTAMHYTPPKGIFMDSLRGAKTVFTYTITLNPAFKLRNLVRDSVHVLATSNANYNPFENITKGVLALEEGSLTNASINAGGGTFHFGYSHDSDGEASRNHLLREAGILDSNPFHKAGRVLFGGYQRLGDKSENANRAALYMKLREDGYDHLSASFEARDIMDFSQKGDWPSAQHAIQMIPFLNARIQGLDKMGRTVGNSGMDSASRARFLSILSVVGGLSIMALAHYREDEDWKKRSQHDRDSYFWFKVDGQIVKIPKPFELGAMASMIERSYEFYTSNMSYADRDLFLNRTWHILQENLAVPTLFDIQLFKPAYEVSSNLNSFTDRNIESVWDQHKPKSERYHSGTTETAKWLSQWVTWTGEKGREGYGGLSPVQIDHLARGYFSYVSTVILGIGDLIIEANTDIVLPSSAVSRKLNPVASFYSDKETDTRNRYFGLFYDHLDYYKSEVYRIKKADEEGQQFTQDEKIDYHRKYAIKEALNKRSKALSLINNAIKLNMELKKGDRLIILNQDGASSEGAEINSDNLQKEIVRLKQWRNSIAQNTVQAVEVYGGRVVH